MAETQTYIVQGMTCGHCEAAVRDAVAALDGVARVEVDLASGALTVVADGEGPARAQVADAVDDAGYALAP